MTEVLALGDSREQKLRETKKAGLKDLIKRDTWKFVSKRGAPKDKIVVNKRFVLAIKERKTEKGIWKAQFAV